MLLLFLLLQHTGGQTRTDWQEDKRDWRTMPFVNPLRDKLRYLPTLLLFPASFHSFEIYTSSPLSQRPPPLHGKQENDKWCQKSKESRGKRRTKRRRREGGAKGGGGACISLSPRELYWRDTRRLLEAKDCLSWLPDDTAESTHNDSLQAGVLLVISESWIYCSVIFLVQQVLSESTLYIFLLPAVRDEVFPRSSIEYCGVINILFCSRSLALWSSEYLTILS